MKKGLNRIEKEIVRVMIKEDRFLSINEVSKLTGISWITVKKYIPKLTKKGIIEYEK